MKLGRFGPLCLALIVILTCSCGGPEETKLKFFNKGKSLYETGHYAESGLEFKNALQIDRNFAEAYYMLGLVQIHEKNGKKAYKLLSKAVELNPELLDAQAALGRILLIAQQKDMAREKADLVLSKNPGHEEAMLLQASLLISDGEDEKAMAILESIIENNEEKADARLMLANLKENKGDLSGARTILQQLLEHDEQHRTARLLLIRILEKEGNFSGVEDAYKILILQNPEDDGPRLMLARFYIRTKRDQEAEKLFNDLIATRPGEIVPRLYLAQFYEQRQDEEAMLAALQEAMEDLPDQFGAYEMMAKYYLQKENDEKAIELMEAFLKRVHTGPDFAKAKLVIAHIHYGKADPEKALQLAEEILKENSADINAHDLKGTILAVRGDFRGAIAEYRAVLRQEPQNVPVLLHLAKAHLLSNQTGLAEDTFKKVLEIDPDESKARFGLADVYRRKGQLTEAKKQLQQVLMANPDDTRALMELGDLALASEDSEAARNYFGRLAALEPDAVQYNFYKQGMVKLVEKKPEEAAPLFEKALEADPDFVPAFSRLIDTLLMEKDLDKAIHRCREQITRSPDNSHYHVLLGRLHVAGKDGAAGRKAFENALEIDPKSPDALFGLAELERSSGSLDEAIARYKALRERYPNNVGIALVVATLLEKRGEFAEAKDIYVDILKKTPDVHLAANNLAFFYAEHEPTIENLMEGERLILPVLRESKDHPSYADTAAWIYYRQGDFVKARDILLSVEKKIGTSPSVQYHLGMIFLGLEQKAEAKKHLEIAVTSNQDFPGRREAEKALKDLG